jgi:hypothetical protein
MRIKIYLSIISCAVLALTTIGFSQNPRIVRWETSNANSKRIFNKDVVVKQLSVDGVDEVTVTASIRERSDSFSVELEVRNHGKKNLDVRPEDIQLQMIRPWSRNLPFISAETIARRIIDSENLRASRIESAGANASRTVVQHVPVTEVSPNPESINDPTKPAVTVNTRIDVVTKIEPDYPARNVAASQSDSVRKSAEGARRRIVSAALQPAILPPGSQTGGMIYYYRETEAREVLLRIPLGELTVEIPFTAVWKSGLRFE